MKVPVKVAMTCEDKKGITKGLFHMMIAGRKVHTKKKI